MQQDRAHHPVRLRIIRVELERALDALFAVILIEVGKTGAGADPHGAWAGEICIRRDGALEPTRCFAQVFVDNPAETMVFEPAQMKLVSGHRLGLEPASGRDVAFLDAAQHSRCNAGDQPVEPIDQIFKAFVESIAPHNSAGFGL